MKRDRKLGGTVRRVTEDLHQALLMNRWPTAKAGGAFGIESKWHYAALRHCVIQEGLTVEELHEAAGCGLALTALVRPKNPYHGLTFTTSWDDTPRDDPPPGGSTAAPRFSPGRVVSTPGALEAVSEAEIRDALRRHLTGDWGEVCDSDRAENDAALRNGNRLLSAYRTSAGQIFWVLTEADRSVTTVLLPDEY